MKKWGLNIGCHRNTITSRDLEYRKFNTRQEAVDSYLESKKSWNRWGYVVWFAEIISPDGTKEMLESNPCYGR